MALGALFRSAAAYVFDLKPIGRRKAHRFVTTDMMVATAGKQALE